MPLRLTQEELDEQFQLFLKESLSDDSVDLGGIPKEAGVADRSNKSSQKSAQKSAVSTVPWWDDDDHGDRGAGGGLLGSGKTFRKSLRKSQPFEEKCDVDAGDGSLRMETAMFIRDNTDTKGDLPCGPVMEMSLGLDTLEEQEEKARFFAQMEAEASSTIDYSKLNRELDSTSSTVGTKLSKPEVAVEESDEVQSKVKVTATDRKSPDSPHYSEDFEEENSEEALKEKSEMSAILSKGQSYVQSGGSEMEAIHEAYRQISHAGEDSEDHHHNLSLEEKEGSNWLPSPPQHAVQSLQPASTTESDLPTAEELMKPIRPEKDHIRVFTLQPSSVLQPDQDKTSWSWERTSPQSNSKQLGQTEIKGAGELTRLRSSSPEPSNYDLTRTIRAEVERLMQGKNEPLRDRQSDKAKKQQAVCGSTITHHSTSLVRKPTAAHIRGKSSGLSRAAAAAAATAKSKPPISQTLEYGLKPTKSNKKDDCKHTESGVKVSSDPMAFVQSQVSVLQQQMDNHKPQDATETQDVRGPQDARLTQHLTKTNQDENSSLVDELRVRLAQMEKHHTEELTSLRQQNYVLQSKLRSAEEHNQKRRWMESAATVTEEKLQLINKEIQEQDVLIKGYQQENEKLYQQMKNLQAKSKANEEAMFHENQRLLNELTLTREQLNETPRHMGNVGLMDPSKCTAELLAQINTIQRNEAKLSEEIHKLKQQNQALDVNLQRMKEERDLTKAQATSILDSQTIEMRVQDKKHREEVAALKKKLQWCAENHQLLDRDSARLKAASAEIQQLQEQVRKLKINVGRRDGEQQKKTKERAMDNMKIQNLEQQVKKLEHILTHRNPNSLPALIYAAATADREVEVNTAGTSSLNQLLEQRVQRLEAELEGRDEQAKLRLQTLEQQYHMMKLRYEQRISELEQQLEQEGSLAGTEPLLSRVQTLKEELQRVKEIQQSKERSLQDQIESLQQQLIQKAQPSPAQNQSEAVQIDQLNQELTAKTQTIQELTCTVERLQKERRTLLSVTSSRQQSHSWEDNQQPAPGDLRIQECGREETFPPTHEKTYQPILYTGSHITEVLQENEALRQHLDLLKLQSEQEKKALKANVKRTEDELCRLKENFAERLSSMKAEHLKALDHLRVTHALEHSSSKVAELKNKVDTQETMIKHLQDQLKQSQLTRPEAQNPKVELLCSLERKILNLELRHEQRERDLQQVIVGSRQVLGADQQSEVDHWKHLVQVKRRELETFCLELDSILDLLRQLHKQEVVLPS